MKLNQKGFGAVEGLLVVIALTLIVGVGFYVVNANKDDTKNQSSTSNAESAKPAESKQTQATPQKTDEELVIEAAKKAGVENFDGSRTPVETAKVDSIIGNNAKGSAGFGTEGGGYAFIAHKADGKWEIVYTGQQLPGRDIGEKYKLPSDWYDANY